MGMNFSHCDAHWSYGGFIHFRARLAAEIGVTLADIAWDKVDDTIVPLLDHSDCEGELTPNECQRIAPRLRELVARWPKGDFDRDQAERLASGMEFANKNNEPLEFR